MAKQRIVCTKTLFCQSGKDGKERPQEFAGGYWICLLSVTVYVTLLTIHMNSIRDGDRHCRVSTDRGIE